MKRRLLIAAGLVVALVVGTGIGLTSLSGASSVHSAIHTTSSTSSPPCTSASYTLTIDVSPPTGTAFSTSVTGQVDFSTDALTANLTLPSDLPIGALAGADIQVVLVGGTAYVTVPPGLSGFVGGASWVSITLPSAINSAVNAFLSKGAQWCANSQSLTLSLSKGGSRTSLGSSTIGNEPASGVQVEQVGKRISSALKIPRPLAKQAGALIGSSQVPVDVWTDGQGHLAELSVQSPNLSITLALTNVNQQADITAPSGAVPLPSGFLKLLGSL